MNIEKLKKTYLKYGFEIKKVTPDVAVFGVQQGRYYGVDIVPLNDNFDTTEIEAQFKRLGYAITTIKNPTLEKIDLSLFDSFFSYEISTEILKSRHKEYIDSRSTKLGIEYEYIPCPYVIVDQKDNLDSALTIDQNILRVLSNAGPQLVILEAAASYGKTATSYQVLKNYLSSSEKNMPLFSELYKNRQARIFRYILLDEKERLFPHLKAEIVVDEIKTGRVPVIIDGFDELLLKSNATDGEDFEDISTMLATIGELLEGNAKILLTTRKTALFSGDEFYDWMIEHEDDFSITRYEIQKPDIVAWIGYKKLNVLEAGGIPIGSISSPVLLAHIRAMSLKDLVNNCTKVERLIYNFFEQILTREQERQDLLLTPEEQLDIFKYLAGLFVFFGITSEQKSPITSFIKDKFEKKISQTLLLYPPSRRPTMDEFVEKLSNHALLDRIGNQDDNIGFLNDFIFGYLIGEYVLDGEESWIKTIFQNEFFTNISLDAFGILKNNKTDLYLQRINTIFHELPQPTKLLIEKAMKSALELSYHSQMFDKFDFLNITISKENCFSECFFTECIFENVTIHKKAFQDVSFYNCIFNNCMGISDGEPCNGASFYGCKEIGNTIITDLMITQIEEPEDEVENYFFEKIVLRNIFPKGRPNMATKRSVRTLFGGVRSDQKRFIPEAIDNIVRMGFLTIDGQYAFVARDKMADISKFLGEE